MTPGCDSLYQNMKPGYVREEAYINTSCVPIYLEPNEYIQRVTAYCCCTDYVSLTHVR